ncbi:type 1 glutamine amidotransferase family protein [Blastopirellula retiformator]|uniref:Uncharacterized protein n=1 Tax=Blastopirellula retiformator TaxID=2527970 RepID=A0A5C5VK48_9BACT|nr:hypothetical protein [Blastopirellula retiformator]TWT38441.1 hypothetical protein Enr8_01330 [Blastopirellula retiformator]
MANPPIFPRRPSPGAGRSWPIIFPVVVFSVIIAFVMLIVCSGGFLLVTGTQFHPEGFRIRRFVALRIPIIGVQAGGTTYTDDTPQLSKLLVNKGWIARAPLKPAEAEWELIEIDGDWKGSPRYLTDYLRDDTTRVSLNQWSEDNPLLAGMLWSEIEQAAKLKLYWMAPEMINKMIDFSQLKPVSKSLTKDARADQAKKTLTAYLLTSYQQTQTGAKASGETELASACAKQIERLESVGVVIPTKAKTPEKQGDTQSKKENEEKSDPKKSDEKQEVEAEVDSEDAFE